MNTCCGETCSFCLLFANINWLAYIVSVIVVYIVGAAWFSWLFKNTWIAVNKIDMDEMSKSNSKFNMFITMGTQFLATALVGLVFFALTNISVWLAVCIIIAIAGWIKASLKFRFSNWKLFFKAAMVDAGYFAVATAIFILFAHYWR